MLRDIINKTIVDLNIKNIKEVDKNKWQQIIQKFEDVFVKKNHYKSCIQPYWDHFNYEKFKNEISIIRLIPTDYSKVLEKLIEPNENLYFLIQDINYKIWVYEGKQLSIINTIYSCNSYYSFEYYVVSKDFSWLICENDHGILLGIGKKVKNKMEKIEF